MAEHTIPSKADVESYLTERRNWGRWGNDDEVGAINLITAEKRLQAASLIRTGQVVSLSRELPKTPALNNPRPAQHYMRTNPRAGGGSVTDFYGTEYHGQATTHLDALCHVWVGEHLWNGRKPGDVIGHDGAHWGSVDKWSNGIVTRGVFLDVPRFRNEPYVTLEKPVHGWELEDVAKAEGITLEPGDAVIVYSGRDPYNRAGNVWGYGSSRPGLHASCLPFLRDNDVSILVWDMMDAEPNAYDLPWQVHPAIAAYGIGLVDNALLEPVAGVCAEQNRYEFMLILAPLVVIGGTGSPLNPLAMF